MSMPTWLATVLIAAGTSVVARMVPDLTVVSRLDARRARVKAVHDARDRFSNCVITMLTLCGALVAWDIPDDVSDIVRARLEGESERWRGLIDETTVWLIDNSAFYALSWPRNLRVIAGRYATETRGVWLSERTEADKVRLLGDLTAHIQSIYFIRLWRVMARAEALRNVQNAFDALNSPPVPIPLPVVGESP